MQGGTIAREEEGCGHPHFCSQLYGGGSIAGLVHQMPLTWSLLVVPCVEAGVEFGPGLSLH